VDVTLSEQTHSSGHYPNNFGIIYSNDFDFVFNQTISIEIRK
jgi:hypothetical protein